MKKERSLFSVIILAMVLCVSGLGLTPYATAHEITNINLSPPSPAALLNNEYVNITFDYSTTEAGGVRIVSQPFTNGSLTPNHAFCGSYIYPVGSGAGSSCFKIISGDVIVDQIRFRMYNSDWSVVLLEFFIDVEYHYGNSITNIELSPPSPAALLPLDKVNITFDYATTHPNDVLIFALPRTNGAYTPGSHSSPSPHYPSGKGSGTAWFTIPYGGVVVDEIRIWMTDVGQTVVICELFMPVRYRFCDGTCTWYVDADAPGANTGVDWTNAFNNLQDALAVAVLGDEIKVAEGTYKPDEGGGQTPGSRAATFQLISGVAVRGGYAGWGEPEPDLRNIEVYQTILSGDIGIQGNNSDNSYHVVTGSGTDETAYLDGFTITGGNASYGGGMLNDSSSPTVTNCSFSENTASQHGGGMYNNNYSSPTVTNCSFSGNTSNKHGGGMSNKNYSSPTVTNCTFTNNSSVHWGGGMYNDVESHSTVTNCTFSGNISDTGGGGIGNFSSSPTVTNCTFSSNNSPGGGGMCNNGSSNPTVTNCILWGDIGGEIVDNYIFTTTVTYSDVQGGWGGTGNINNDPCFVDAAGGDLRLSSSASPCVDTGDNSAPNLPATDLAGNQRIFDGDGDGSAIVDMGAYELQSKVHNITKDLWYETIQPAIDDANDGDQIEVAPGTYYEAIDFTGKAVRLYSSGGPALTTIDATGLSSSVVSFTSGEGPNTVLEGFRITGGSGTTVGLYEYGGGMYNLNSSPMVKDCNFATNSVTGDGGGMYNNNSSPTVINCRFSANYAAYAGGGMDNRNSSSPTVADCTFSQNTAGSNGGGLENWTGSNSTVTNCTFSGNSAEVWGGGMFNDDSSPTVTNCTFSNNSALYAGGMHNNYSSPTVTNCTFSGNSADYGGGMRNDLYSSSTITNCTFTENSATLEGGGMRNYASNPTVTNCTFSGNTAGNNGGGIHNHISSPTVTNCILWNDAPNEIFNDTSTPIVTYSDVEGGYVGTGNINADPCFVDAVAGNLRLLYDSPCIDAGDNKAPGLSATDLDGNRRLFDGDGNGSTIVDMGAYEFGSIKLVAHWRLDESSGEVAYDSISDNHGTLEPGPAVWRPAGGRIGGALEFDGLNDFVSIPNESNFDVTERLTIAAWIKVNAFDRGWQAIVTKGDYAWRIQRDAANNALEFAVSGTSAGYVLGSVNVNDGQWHHAAGVYDGTMIYLYVDGVVDNSAVASGTISTNDYPVIIGENAERPGRCWNGLIDDVAMFSRALDGTEITNLKNSGGASFLADPDLKALWELDESSGTTASDSAGGNHGTLEPALTPPVWQPSGGWLGGALEFDGVDDFVSIPNESRFDIAYQLTVSAWIQVAAFDKDWQAIVTKGDAAWRLHRLRDTNSITFHCNNYPYWGADGNIGVDDGQWHHVAGVYDGTRAYLYVDGALDNSEPAFGLISKNDFPVMIGENAELPGRCWNGLIDDVRIYTSALNSSEIYMLYSNICYVDADATGNNDGSSWSDAFNYLQDALAQATSGWEIHVAEGTYKPDAKSSNPSGTGDRTATFQLVNGVILKGGYAGAGTPDPNARDVDTYQTVLSGDIGIDSGNSDNCYHVVTSSGCDLYTVLDGFTITGGNASGTGSDSYGGGMYCESSSPTVTNCTFKGNSTSSSGEFTGGGGMYNNGSNPTVTDCNFSGNSARRGGGMYNHNNSNPTVTNCTFEYNTILSAGGGMYNYVNSSPTVSNCTFRGNSANHWGAGMYNDIDSNSIVTNCTFINNTNSDSGGGMANYHSNPKVTNCTFGDNSTDLYGGGMFNTTSSNPTVTNCTFSGNSAYRGSGMYNNVSSPTVTDCTFSDNTADNHAGGMYNNNSSSTVTSCIFTGNTSSAGGGMFNGGGSPAVTNCIFSGNSAGYGAGMWNYGSTPTVTNCTFSTNAGSVGGGMYNEAGSNATVTNCIFWGDTSNEIVDNASSPTVAYSDVQGGYGGTGNIDADPCFVDASAGNLRLSPGSPCIDAGDNSAPNLEPNDLDGHPRIIDGDCDDIDVVDMGAYEFAFAYVGDFDNNCSVNFFDFSIFGRAWLTQKGDPDWDEACDISYPPDDYIDWRDAAVLCDNWLATP